MNHGIQTKNFLFPSLVVMLLLLPAGCFYHVNLKAPAPLNFNPMMYQPVVLFPIPDASDHPQSGAGLGSYIRGSLKEKGYVLVKEDEVADALKEMELTTLLLLSDPDALVKIAQRLKAKLLIIGTIPEYKVQKSYWGADTFQVWDQDSRDYLSLPTYHRGTSYIRLILRFFEPENGSLVWEIEGGVRGPSTNTEEYGRKLADRLLRDLPSLPPSTKG